MIFSNMNLWAFHNSYATRVRFSEIFCNYFQEKNPNGLRFVYSGKKFLLDFNFVAREALRSANSKYLVGTGRNSSNYETSLCWHLSNANVVSLL